MKVPLKPHARIAATLCAIALSGAAVHHLGALTPVVSFGTPTSLDLQGTDVIGRVVEDFDEDGRVDVMVTISGVVANNVRLA
jgi:hypothetical protein